VPVAVVLVPGAARRPALGRGIRLAVVVGRAFEAAAATLDLRRPVAFMLPGVAGLLGNDREMSYVIRQLTRAAALGSCLVLAEGSAASPSMAAVAGQYAAMGARIYYLRDLQQLEQLFGGLELIPPGVVPTPDWHPARPALASGAEGDGEAEAYSHCGEGRSPPSHRSPGRASRRRQKRVQCGSWRAGVAAALWRGYVLADWGSRGVAGREAWGGLPVTKADGYLELEFVS
jgi:hypothetical protein